MGGSSALPTSRSDGDLDPPADELASYVRRNLLRAVVGLVALVGAVGALGVLYEPELFAATQWVHRQVGVPGLMTLLFVSDSLITPVPPDFILVILAKSELSDRAWYLLPLMGAISVVAGNTAFLMGSRLGEVGWLDKAFGGLRRRHRLVVARYGRVAVGLGALTPIPFSVTCWTAGVLRMRWSELVLPTLLRIPRFYLYYALIAYADELVRWLL